jgi:hypothetical protein
MGFLLILGVRSSRYLSGLYLYGNDQIYRVGEFLGAFAKLRKATISFVMSVRPSVCPNGTTRLPLDGVSWNATFEYFAKKCRQNSRFIKIWQEKRLLYMKTNIYFWSYLAQFFLECEMLVTKVLEEIKTQFVFNKVFFRKSCLFEIIWKIWWGGLGHRQQHCEFALHAGCLRLQIHTFVLWITQCFFSVQQWLQARASMLRVYVHCLSCYIVTVVTVMITAFWAVTSCSLVKGCWCFEGPYRHLQHSTLKMKVISFSETYITSFQMTCYHVIEGSSNRCKLSEAHLL